MPDAIVEIGHVAAALRHWKGESRMKRSIPLALILASAVAAQVALTACDGHDTVATDPGAGAPEMSASLAGVGGNGTQGGMGDSSGAPMDSISSASAVAGSDGASAAEAQVRDAMRVAVSAQSPTGVQAGRPSRRDAPPPR
jgi:hypothetical protein